MTKLPSSRMLVLDYLRGFFIIVIIIDHLYRWPSLLQYVGGRGELWVSSAEGFVIISGLLVGYVRGYKNLSLPMRTVAKKLVRRGLLLYLWAVITTIFIVAVLWLVPTKGSFAYIPYGTYDWTSLVLGAIKLDYVHTLTYFLYLYAVFLVLAPIVVWMLRKSLWWILVPVSIIGWLIGYIADIEWLQWQILFYLPAIAGFYLEKILSTYRALPRRVRQLVATMIMGLTTATVILSASIILPYEPTSYKLEAFSRDPMMPARIGLSFIWFLGFALVFSYGMPWIKKYLGWLLFTFGERSLTAYILQIVPLLIVSIAVLPTSNIWLNTFIGVVCVIVTWAILKIPNINKIVPR